MARLLSAALVSWLVGAPALAGGGAPGPEFQVNTYTTLYQSAPSVAADDSGNFVVVWESYGQDGSGDGVFGRRYDAAGAPLGDEFAVNRYTTQQQRSPSVAMDGAGNLIVVWQSSGQTGLDVIFGRRYDATGASFGGEFQISTDTSWHEHDPAVSMTEDGSFVVIWESAQGGIDGRRFDPAGNPTGGEFPVNTHPSGGQGSPSVAADSSGNFVVVWHALYQDGSDRGIFGRRFDAAGSPQGGEFAINTYTDFRQWNPAVASDGTGSFIVVWESYHDPWTQEIVGRRYDAAGDPLGGEFPVNTYTTHKQRHPSIAVDERGDFVVLWGSAFQDGSFLGVFGQRYAGNGDPLDGEFRVNTYTPSNQFHPVVAAHGDGNSVVVWESSYQDGSYSGVFGKRYTMDVFADGFESGDTSAWSRTVP